MTIYTILEFLFFVLFFIELNGPHTESRRLKFFNVEAFLIWFILAFRNFDVGADSPNYVWWYIGSSKYMFDPDNMPAGFVFFCDILKFISKDWRFFMFVTGTISVIPFFYYVKRCAKMVTLPFLTFLLCWKQLWLLETPIKQTTAIFLFFIAFIITQNETYKEKKKVKVICAALIFWSFLTHSSLILFGPLIFVLNYINISKRVSILCIFASLFVSASIINYIPDLFDNLKMYVAAYEVFDNLNNYNEDVAFGLETLNLWATLPQCLVTLSLLFMCGDKQANSIQMKCLVFGTIIHTLFVSFPNIPRVVLLYTLIGSSFCPDNIFELKRQRFGKMYLSLYLLLALFFFYIHFRFCSNFKLTMLADILPYSFWFE